MLRDDEGLPIHLIAQIESLEARRRAEERLAKESERLRITLKSIDDAVITTDAQTRITYLNAAAESLLRLDMQAIAGRRVDEVIHLVDPQSAKVACEFAGPKRPAWNGASARATLLAASTRRGRVLRDGRCVSRVGCERFAERHGHRVP